MNILNYKQSEKIVKNAVASLGPKERRMYEGSSSYCQVRASFFRLFVDVFKMKRHCFQNETQFEVTAPYTGAILVNLLTLTSIVTLLFFSFLLRLHRNTTTRFNHLSLPT